MHQSFKRALRLCCTALCLWAVSCQTSTDQDPPAGDTTQQPTRAQGGAGAVKAASISAPFTILYLRNYRTTPDSGFNQLDKLLNQGPPPIQKVVFQFFQDSANQLTLMAFAGRQGSKDFSRYPFRPMLEVSNVKPDPEVIIQGKKVLFASQEINVGDEYMNDKNIIKFLQDSVVNRPGREIVTFSPVLKSGPGADAGTLTYKLGYWSMSDFLINKEAGFTRVPPTSLDMEANPCPPRNAF